GQATGSDTAARFNSGIPRTTAAPTSRPIKASTALDNASTPKDWPRTEPTDESLSRWYEILSAANAMGNIHTGHVAQRPVLNPVSVPAPVCPAVSRCCRRVPTNAIARRYSPNTTGVATSRPSANAPPTLTLKTIPTTEPRPSQIPNANAYGNHSLRPTMGLTAILAIRLSKPKRRNPIRLTSTRSVISIPAIY